MKKKEARQATTVRKTFSTDLRTERFLRRNAKSCGLTVSKFVEQCILEKMR